MENIDELRSLRISEALDHLDQAHTIFNFVLFSLGRFGGTGDPAWDHRLAAIVNVSNLLGSLPETDIETVVTASEEIVMRRLPRLLCIALVSAIETCLEEITELELRASSKDLPESQISKEVRKLNAGGPLQYLPKLSKTLNIPELAGSDDSVEKLLIFGKNRT